MNWNKLYSEKLVSATEAITHIKSNDYVVVGHACGEPSYLLDVLADHKEDYENVMLMHMVAQGTSPYAQPGMEGYFIHNSFFVGASTRDAVNSGRGVYTPMFQHEIPRLFRRGEIKVNVALIQVSPPDKHGYCSHGVAVDYTKPATEVADIVIAEVNPNMPRTLGDCFVHISDIDYIVETDHPLKEVKSVELDDLDWQIGEYCASLVEDGSTIQLGIGALPDAVAYSLEGKKDLGIHSELIGDAVVDMYHKGIFTGKKKSMHKGKILSTLLLGTRKLYDFVDDNPVMEMYSTDYTNDPRIIAKQHKMVSINAFVQVDLMGQVASESIGLKQISGTGGQVDFIRGASMCPDGKSILVSKSTTKNGKTSKIVPFLDHGATVTTLRNDVDYIITEYGIAKLKGKSLPERAKALIEIAHPNFRDELKEEYERRFFHKFEEDFSKVSFA